jgi:VWFA-related protein
MLVLSCLSVGLTINSSLSGVVAQSGGSFKIRVDVDLVTVEVAALDKKGDPVRNLKKEDFQLHEDGKKQEILSIDEINAASGASPSGVNPIAGTTLNRGKTVLIIFADNMIKPLDIKTSRDSAERFVQEHMRPQDLFAIAAFGFSMKILQNFTSDRKEVLEAIRNSTINAGGTGFSSLVPSVLEGIMESIAPIKGQKSILIYAQSGSMRTSTQSTPQSGQSSKPLISDIPDLLQTNSTVFSKSFLAKAIRSNVVFHVAEPGAAGFGSDWRELARSTGGDIIIGDLEAGLDKLDQKISNYYVLGFRSSNPRHDGAIRKLEIKTSVRGLTMKYQAGYLDRRPVDVLSNTKQETTLMTALANPGTATQLPIFFRTAYFYDSPQIARVLIASRIRLEKTTLKKKGSQAGTELNVMCIAYAEDGSIAARFSETLPVSFEKEKEAEFRKRNVTYHNYLRLRPGKYRLKLAVSDESDNVGSMEQLLEIPTLPDRGLAGSSVLIAEQASRLPDLIRNLQTQMLDENNPLLYAGFQIEPSVDNRLPANAALPVVFRIYNLPGAPDQWNLTAKARIVDEKGKEYSLDPIPLKKTMSLAGASEVAVALSLSFNNAPPGKYRLIVETTELTSAETVTLDTDLELASQN